MVVAASPALTFGYATVLKAEPRRADSFGVAMENDQSVDFTTKVWNSRCDPRSSAQR